MWTKNQVLLDLQTLLTHKILASHFGLEYLERQKSSYAFGNYLLKQTELKLLNAVFNVENASREVLFQYELLRALN